MEKTYHFMAGLPRSGSTVLAAILSQHPDIYASPQTDLIGMLYELNTQIPSYESHKAGVLHEGYKNVLNNVANNFYNHIDKPIIIDKNRSWGTPYNFNELKPYVSPSGKVILTMRPMLEVLASFVKIAKESEKITHRNNYSSSELWVSNYRNEVDAMADYLMMPNGEIDKAIFSIANLVKNHTKETHIVWFNDLLSDPKNTMNKILIFLGADPFEYDFNNIQETDKHNDLNGYGIIGLHSIAKELKNPVLNPEKYLSNYVINKYKNTLDFLNF
jgi:sulfotransferase